MGRKAKVNVLANISLPHDDYVGEFSEVQIAQRVLAADSAKRAAQDQEQSGAEQRAAARLARINNGKHVARGTSELSRYCDFSKLRAAANALQFRAGEIIVGSVSVEKRIRAAAGGLTYVSLSALSAEENIRLENELPIWPYAGSLSADGNRHYSADDNRKAQYFGE